MNTSDERPAQPDVLKARSPEDLLAIVPYRLGFHPRDSLVVMALHGSRRRFGFTARVDLPPLPQVPDMARYLMDVLVQQRADETLLVAYAEDDTVAGPLVNTLRQWLGRTGVELVDAYRADGNRWFCYTCDEPCCPDDGTPYDISDHALVAEHVLRGQVALPDRDSLRDQVAAVAADRAAEMAPAFTAVEEDLATVLEEVEFEQAPFVRAAMAWVREFVEAWLASPRQVTDIEVALLSVRVSMIPVRDLAWSLMSRETAAAHRELWQQVVTRVITPYVPAVACLTSFAAWLEGQGALAWCAVERALDADPDYSWAHLIVQTLEGALPPETWQPLPLEEIEGFAS